MTHSPKSKQQVENLGRTIVANLSSGISRYKQPAFLAKDGATFHGIIQQMPDNQFQASCSAQLENGDTTKVESPEYSLHNTKSEAKSWIDSQAIKRGFSKWYDESKQLSP